MSLEQESPFLSRKYKKAHGEQKTKLKTLKRICKSSN